MKALGFVGFRVDDRMVHGIVATDWIPSLNATRAMVIDDAASKNDIMKTSIKMATPGGQLFLRGLLCNILVCLATWMCYKLKEETAKILMIFWCLFTFITAGFEHSVANMTLLTIALLAPGTAAVSISGYIYNIGMVTLGNMVGGILFVAIPYYLISKKSQ